MKKDNYILSVIDDIKSVLEKSDYTKERYSNDVAWLDEKVRLIKKNIVRVAIMGITSSGKSTLVNALLQEKLLPVAIKPSSSIIITCSKGVERQAVIYFNDGSAITLSGEELNEDNLGAYCDENRNPDNELDVSQINITTPSFMLGENIHIIDSPGLDACDLEIHEKITMEILLPTIDICLFLTTVKASSDEINSEKMRIVHRRGKQIILVQNMIDSIEAKIGKNGIVEESKAEILKKHKKRGENLLKTSITDKKSDEEEGKSLNDTFEVVQISALNALKAIIHNDYKLYEKSNFDEFIKGMERCVEKLAPKITRQREISLINKIESIIKTDKEIIYENNSNKMKMTDMVTRKDVDDAFKNFKKLKEEINFKIENMDQILNESIENIKHSEDYDVKSCEKIIRKINDENQQIEDEILIIVKACEYKKNELYKKLNLDIVYSYSIPNISFENVHVMHKNTVKTKMIKKQGMLNKGKRLLSNVFDTKWGYEEKLSNDQIIDKKATIKLLENVCDVNRVKYVSILKEWTKQYTRSMNLFYNEVSKQEKDLYNKKHQGIELYHIEGTFERLEKIKRELILRKNTEAVELEAALTQDSETRSSYIDNSEEFKMVNVAIQKNSYNIYKIINNICEQNYKIVGNYINKEVCKRFNGKAEDIFWTWDEESAVKFIARIKGKYLSESEIKDFKKNGLYKCNNITIVYENNINKLSLYEKLKKSYGSTYNMYLIFNGIQISNSEKYIMNNVNLKEFLEYNNVIMNLVVDSYKEFFSARNIKELLFEVYILKRKLIKKFNDDKIGRVLINAKNPIYNMVLIECENKSNFIISTYKQVKEIVMTNLLSRGEEEKEIIEEILSFFLENGQKVEDNHGR
ncbi:MAG: dynamin family protein [Clostridium sp.]